jgi:N-methylhydantoinase A/oxoprolinase/acetone carboxylase beta subunit
LDSQAVRYSDKLEYWILRREPKQPVEDKQVQAILALLRERPQRLWDLKQKVGSLIPLLVRELIDLEIIDRTGLTPTDLLHVTGEFCPWDGEAAEKGTEIAAQNWEENREAFVRRVRKAMTNKLAGEAIQFLSQRALSEPGLGNRNHAMDRWLFEESLDQKDAYLGCRIFLKLPIVGIGAPAKAFLPPVAEALGTTITFPEHCEVANAVGTVVGNVMVRQEGEVFPCVEGASITGYFARAVSSQWKFARFEEALAYTRETLSQRVAADVKMAGAEGAPIEWEEKKIWDGMVHLSVWAIGKLS